MSPKKPPRVVFQRLDPREQICRCCLDVHPDGPLAGYSAQEGRIFGQRYLRRRPLSTKQLGRRPQP